MGDFQQHFSRPDTGINTVEGNVAGSRAAGLSKKRAAEQAEFEAKAKKIRDDADRQKLGIDAKFDTNTNVSKEEQTFRSKTVGLVSAADFKKASAEVCNLIVVHLFLILLQNFISHNIHIIYSFYINRLRNRGRKRVRVYLGKMMMEEARMV